MHKVIQDEVRTLGPKKLCYLPSYLAQLYAYGDCQLVIEKHHKVLVGRVIKEVYGTSEDELIDEEEVTYEETEEESTEVSKPQQNGIDTRGLVSALLNLGERQEEGRGQHRPDSRVELVIRTRDMETQTDQGSEIQGGMGTTQIPIDYMDTRMEQLYPSPELGDEEEERLVAAEVEEEEGDYV
ncbi:unnamed protein product [Sphagnum balticum]